MVSLPASLPVIWMGHMESVDGVGCSLLRESLLSAFPSLFPFSSWTSLQLRRNSVKKRRNSRWQDWPKRISPPEMPHERQDCHTGKRSCQPLQTGASTSSLCHTCSWLAPVLCLTSTLILSRVSDILLLMLSKYLLIRVDMVGLILAQIHDSAHLGGSIGHRHPDVPTCRPIPPSSRSVCHWNHVSRHFVLCTCDGNSGVCTSIRIPLLHQLCNLGRRANRIVICYELFGARGYRDTSYQSGYCEWPFAARTGLRLSAVPKLRSTRVLQGFRDIHGLVLLGSLRYVCRPLPDQEIPLQGGL